MDINIRFHENVLYSFDRVFHCSGELSKRYCHSYNHAIIVAKEEHNQCGIMFLFKTYQQTQNNYVSVLFVDTLRVCVKTVHVATEINYRWAQNIGA